MTTILTPTPATVIPPPFSLESAILKVRKAEDAWKSRDPERVSLAYTEDSVWRNRTEFPVGREQIRRFLAGKWDRELEYRLVKRLWAFTGNRIAVKFEYEWHDHAGNWFRSYGNELWEFDDRGLMRRREASINDRAIPATDRKFFWPAPAPGPRTTRASNEPGHDVRTPLLHPPVRGAAQARLTVRQWSGFWPGGGVRCFIVPAGSS